jgi:hypothetical protein
MSVAGVVAVAVYWRIEPELTGNLWAVTTFDAQHIVAVGGTQDDRGGLVLARSDDAGIDWTISRPSNPALVTVAAAGDRLVGATDCYQQRTDTGPIEPAPTTCLYGSDDRGQTWSDLGAGRLVDPTFADASDGWTHTPNRLGHDRPCCVVCDDRWWYHLAGVGRPCDGDTPWSAGAALVEPRHGYIICRGLYNAAPGRLSRSDASSVAVKPGHLMGAAGAVEGVFTVLSVHHQVAPATLNYRDEDPEINLNVVHGSAREMPIRYAVSDNIGLGGHNGAVIFKHYVGD